MKTRALMIALVLAAGAARAELPDSIVMPHDVHFANDVECALCHEGVDDAVAGASLRPSMEACAACHDVEDGDACVMCHTNVDEAGTYARRAFAAPKFAHAPHVGAGLACATCHGDPAGAERPIPVKRQCRACHATADDFGDCRLCHADETTLRPADHAGAWTARHGALARADETACALCHTQAGCQDCHAGDNVRPRTHGLDFAWSHASAARGRETDCTACHREPAFCASCHAAQQVLPRDHSRVDWV
ncbi:MAG TPA: hypothetical protein PLQ13_08100, partial [Candidatus Krumholzibacteria bacterium]|nr:hypothetical protein [Candidatus Krumholzibacteria bacterium]